MEDDLTEDQKSTIKLAERLVLAGWVGRMVRKGAAISFEFTPLGVQGVKAVRHILRTSHDDPLTLRDYEAFFRLMEDASLERFDAP